METKEFMAKVAGKAKELGAVLSGDKGIFRKLKEEHGEISALLHQVARTNDGDLDTRRRLFPKIERELHAHTEGEKAELYSLLEQHERTRALAQHSLDEHQEIDRLLEVLKGTDYGAPNWIGSFKTLMDAVDNHIREEEERLFPLAKEVIDGDEAKQIERRYLDQRHRFEERRV